MTPFHGKVACGVALLLTSITWTASAAVTTSSCSPTKVRYMTSDLDTSSTKSNSLAVVPEASISFTQGGTKASCVIVRFSAVTFASGTNVVRVQAVLDGTHFAAPGEVEYSGDDGEARNAHSFEFIFPVVAPGNHVVRMMYRSFFPGAEAVVGVHTTVVQHAP